MGQANEQANLQGPSKISNFTGISLKNYPRKVVVSISTPRLLCESIDSHKRLMHSYEDNSHALDLIIMCSVNDRWMH